MLLSSVVFGMLADTRVDLRLAKSHGDRVQARYLALAGVERAKAEIWRDLEDRKLLGTSHRTRLRDDESAFRDQELGRGLYRVFRRGDQDEGPQRIVYGLRDEESRLHVNTSDADSLAKLTGLLPDVAAAIVDWRDNDENPTPQGAEQAYYAELAEPYSVRNAPFETFRELLMVRGVDPQQLLGEDSNANGVLDPEERDGELSPPNDNGDSVLDRGWSEYLALENAASNTTSRGETPVDITTATEETLLEIPGMTQDIAAAIVKWREGRRLSSIFDLLEVRRIQEPQGEQSGEGEPTGPTLIDQALLKQIADEISATAALDVAGAVNVNTASEVVLRCLPGISDDLAATIVAHRKSNGPFETVAHLLDVPGATVEVLKGAASKLVTRSSTWRVLSEGVVPSTGARRTIEVVVRVSNWSVDTLSYREEP